MLDDARRGGIMDDRTSTRETGQAAGHQRSADAIVSRSQDIPDGPPAQVRPQDPDEPLHVIDPGDVGGVGQHLVNSPPSGRPRAEP